MSNVSAIDEVRMQVLRNYFSQMAGKVQPVEKPHGANTDYRGRKAEILSPDTLGKPPQPKIEVVSYPDLIRKTPDNMRLLLEDGRVRIRINPSQLRELEALVSEFGLEAIQNKFIIDPQTGRRVDTLA